MFERISNGWELTKQSFRVLSMDKKLLVFPFLSGIACSLVLASFALPLWMSGYIESVLGEEHPQLDAFGYAVLFAFYAVNYFVIVFFNSAVVACAVVRFNGEEPTLSIGLNAAMQRLPQILGWALVAASVGVLMRIIESRSEKVGRLVAGLLGMAWTIVTFFVVPVIVVEKAGPIEAMRRSTAILKKTWGESLTAHVGTGVIFSLFHIPALVLIGAGVFVAAVNLPLGILIGSAGVVMLLIIALISTATNTIILSALYLYAVTGRVPEAFNAERLRGAFTPKYATES